jgi:hypothetical protein
MSTRIIRFARITERRVIVEWLRKKARQMAHVAQGTAGNLPAAVVSGAVEALLTAGGFSIQAAGIVEMAKGIENGEHIEEPSLQADPLLCPHKHPASAATKAVRAMREQEQPGPDVEPRTVPKRGRSRGVRAKGRGKKKNGERVSVRGSRPAVKQRFRCKGCSRLFNGTVVTTDCAATARGTHDLRPVPAARRS